jgi:hypothetical protein
MNIYWTLKSIPELSRLPLRERGRAWRAVWRKAFRHWQVWVAFVVVLGLAVFFGKILSQPIGEAYAAIPTRLSPLGGGLQKQPSGRCESLSARHSPQPWLSRPALAEALYVAVADHRHWGAARIIETPG